MNRVFGYGSLMWRPGFAHTGRFRATLRGYHRAFCRYSWRHRGTPEAPGLVIGLRPGGACEGYGFSYGDNSAEEVLAYLDDREGAGYLRLSLPLEIAGNSGPEREQAWVYLPNPDHPTCAPHLQREEIVHLVATGVGFSGTSFDYLDNLIEQLGAMGIDEPEFLEVLKAAEGHRHELEAAGSSGSAPRSG